MCLGLDVGGQPRRSADRAAGHASGASGGDQSRYGPRGSIRQGCGLVEAVMQTLQVDPEAIYRAGPCPLPSGRFVT
jgi:hypothetical protein